MVNSSRFFFNDTATTEIYTLSLHDALPISALPGARCQAQIVRHLAPIGEVAIEHFSNQDTRTHRANARECHQDRKSTRLNSSHANISYAVFCLKKKHRTDKTCKAVRHRISS